MEIKLVDTNILIDFLKGDSKIVDKIGFKNLAVNDIVIMELFQGAKSKSDLNFIKKSIRKINILEINQDIITLAKDILQEYNLSHNMKINDAIIASTSIIYSLELVTFNKKDFKFIPDIKLVEI